MQCILLESATTGVTQYISVINIFNWKETNGSLAWIGLWSTALERLGHWDTPSHPIALDLSVVLDMVSNRICFSFLGKCEWRSHSFRASYWSIRSPHPGHSTSRNGQNGSKKRSCSPLCWWWDGHCSVCTKGCIEDDRTLIYVNWKKQIPNILLLQSIMMNCDGGPIYIHIPFISVFIGSGFIAFF